jgi:hypothetical protein
VTRAHAQRATRRKGKGYKGTTRDGATRRTRSAHTAHHTAPGPHTMAPGHTAPRAREALTHGAPHGARSAHPTAHGAREALTHGAPYGARTAHGAREALTHGAHAHHTGRRNGATSTRATRYLDCRMAQRRITTRDGATCSRSQRVGVAPTRVQGGKAVCQESAPTRRKMRANAKESTENLRVFAPFQIGLGMVSERSLTIQNGRKVARSRNY